ncbi:MAG TPA: hypothetical protein PLN06_10810 [Bacteroidales bacterium]|nr:hypothetical protein [Bacteroidales bacterium]HOU97092.1 hypothetical protein [Bacteroidales bacterium]HQG36655.1 hypothetical protein [Bacteroidales bacterium]HQG52787.1 hypothetical protein [Bacteroidales bacterium]HQJ20761.1 hypothetical protein [Bacteroidales bacterium]
MLLAYSGTSIIGGNGFLAIYLADLYLGNQALLHKRTIMIVFDRMA